MDFFCWWEVARFKEQLFPHLIPHITKQLSFKRFLFIIFQPLLDIQNSAQALHPEPCLNSGWHAKNQTFASSYKCNNLERYLLERSEAKIDLQKYSLHFFISGLFLTKQVDFLCSSSRPCIHSKDLEQKSIIICVNNIRIYIENKVKRVWEWTVRKVGMAKPSSKLDVVTTHPLANYCTSIRFWKISFATCSF